MPTVDLSNDAIRFLKKLDKKQFVQVLSALTELSTTPRPPDSIAMGDGVHFRKSVGEFRIIYRHSGDTLTVPAIGNRNDSAVYQEFDRKDN